jgi:hypothetical protein
VQDGKKRSLKEEEVIKGKGIDSWFYATRRKICTAYIYNT